jgi:hypothetical protein
MSVFGSLLCAFNRHKPLRRDVRWDGEFYVGKCRRCGASIRRIGPQKWREINLSSDEVTSDPG